MANDNRKRAVSIRMSSSDVGKVKRLAQRLNVRDSDVIRYAVKTTLARLAPLYDPHVHGRSLVPLFVESASDLFMHFDIDAMRLEGIINDEADDDRRVDREDIQLIAMSGNQPASRWSALATGAKPGALRLSVERTDDAESARHDVTSLKEYLYGKYVFRYREEA